MDQSIKGRWESWIFDYWHPTREALALYRIFTGLFILFFLMPPADLYSHLAALPDDLFTPPPGPMMLFDRFPEAWLLHGVHWLLVLSLVAMTLGVYTRLSSLLSGLFILFLKGFIYSIGKINHDLLLAVIPLLFAFSNWGAAWSVDSVIRNKKEETAGWPLPLLALLIGFMMFTAGFPKILGGWLAFDTQAARGHFLNQYFLKERRDLLAESATGWESSVLWESLDYLTIFFEVGFILAIWRLSSARLFVCFAILFHFSTMMIMNIAFLFNFVAYAAFLNWDYVLQQIRRMEERLAGREPVRPFILKTPILWGLGLVSVFSLVKFITAFDSLVELSDLQSWELLLVSAAVPVALAGIWRSFRSDRICRYLNG